MGIKIAGPTCLFRGAYIDGGTSCLALSSRPGPTGVGLALMIGMGYVGATIIRDLRHDIGAALENIERLPDKAKRDAAYALFSVFFDHYLPKKFLRQYIWEKGRPLALTEREMIDCNPHINVMNCKAFRNILDKATVAGKPVTSAIEIVCPASALTNGTLGQFSVPMRATLTYRDFDDWNLVGKMQFYDEWDFDPKDFTSGGRSLQGELKTRFADYTLPGDGFKITSAEVDFAQSASDPRVNWKGGTPVAAPDKLAQLDINLKNSE